jgi:hypothetical protein
MQNKTKATLFSLDISRNREALHVLLHVLVVFCYKILSGDQPRQCWVKNIISETSSVSIIRARHLTMMMETEQVSETLVFDSTLMQLIAPEDFITFMCHENFKSYIVFCFPYRLQ